MFARLRAHPWLTEVALNALALFAAQVALKALLGHSLMDDISEAMEAPESAPDADDAPVVDGSVEEHGD